LLFSTRVFPQSVFSDYDVTAMAGDS